MGALTPPDEYVAARRTLLDALDALEAHLDSLVLIGSQAIYLHTGPAGLTVPPTTTDADLAGDADLLLEHPDIGSVLRRAGFVAEGNPGHWLNDQRIAIDLMVASHQAGTTKPLARSTRLPPHDKKTARIATGLPLALADNQWREIASLDGRDPRVHALRVAGPTALLVAKVIKASERIEDASRGQSRRIVEKDSLDILRLLQAFPTEEFARSIRSIPQAAPAYVDAVAAIDALRRSAVRQADLLPLWAQSASGDDPTVAASLAYLAGDLVSALPEFAS